MSDKIFIDTNIWIYLFSSSEKEKRNIANDVIKKNLDIVISTQVLNELVNVMSKKFKLNFDDIQKALDDIITVSTVHTVDLATIKQAIALASKHRYSYFDSLMIASALLQKCNILLSEDMHNNHAIEKILLIKNPFEVLAKH